VRALEILEITGRPPSDLRREWDAARPTRPAVLVGIRRDRADLYRRIEARVDRMIEQGLVDEVERLLGTGAGLGPVARQALGYKELADWLEGRTGTLEEAVEILKRRTRTFARRQLTWFKHFDIDWVDVSPDEPPEAVAGRAIERLRRGPRLTPD
jgi:tRNA dimethylallyltransferase